MSVRSQDTQTLQRTHQKRFKKRQYLRQSPHRLGSSVPDVKSLFFVGQAVSFAVDHARTNEPAVSVIREFLRVVSNRPAWRHDVCWNDV